MAAQRIRIVISGANGHMGRTLARMIAEDAQTETVAGVDIAAVKTGDFPVYLDPMEFGGEADVVVDFSSPSALDALLRYAVKRKIPLVLCTTGHTAEQLDAVRAASREAPIFRAGNMSLGINLVAELIKRAAEVLGDGYDAEIVERHHRRKVDAPSGTAIMLADALREAKPDGTQLVFGRADRREARPREEIGIASVRGGTIVGDHEVIFAGTDEIIEIRHTAYSREVFAVGAVRAAKFMAGVKKPGMYDMSDLLAQRK
ncbi:MAG: 4-hydroxy-tetrahydrodipicolinate reductase [Oscillospiraceae bacterium]|jgi:4-hydroxy-tetrahydrodipicolinate reductase|nr:4-hydroxy-tetrahydrodipicolinate reductase [Oscillospiraceae bacterium]